MQSQTVQTETKKPRGPALDQRVMAEAEHIRELLESGGVTTERIEFLTSVIENTAWLKAKLDDARKTIKNGRVIIKYDNGGGQKGSHANPAFKAYFDLWQAYLKGLDKLQRELPSTVPIEMPHEEEKTILGFVLEKHNDRITEPAAQN